MVLSECISVEDEGGIEEGELTWSSRYSLELEDRGVGSKAVD